MISGGLGGSNNRIRFFLVVVGKNGIIMDQFEYIKRVFDKVTKERDSILEEIKMHDFYVSLIILGSFNYAYGEIIESGICLCDFLQTDYYATNVEIPTDERIRDWLDGKLDQEGN